MAAVELCGCWCSKEIGILQPSQKHIGAISVYCIIVHRKNLSFNSPIGTTPFNLVFYLIVLIYVKRNLLDAGSLITNFGWIWEWDKAFLPLSLHGTTSFYRMSASKA